MNTQIISITFQPSLEETIKKLKIDPEKRKDNA